MDSKVSGRYAKSLLELATKNAEQDQVYADMLLLADTADKNRELSLLLKNPIVNHDKKASILKAIFKNKISNISMSFLQLIVNKSRELYLEETAGRFINLYKVQKGIEMAYLKTAIPIGDELRLKIMALIREIAPDKDIELIETVEPKIIGGFVLTVGDRQYDARVSKKINELRMQFVENLYLKDY